MRRGGSSASDCVHSPGVIERRVSVLLVLSLMLPLAVGGASARDLDDRGAPAPVEVTSDTVSYCRSLAGRIETIPVSSDAALRLAREGAAMCRKGRVRDGIVRLRRALMISRNRTPSDD